MAEKSPRKKPFWSHFGAGVRGRHPPRINGEEPGTRPGDTFRGRLPEPPLPLAILAILDGKVPFLAEKWKTAKRRGQDGRPGPPAASQGRPLRWYSVWEPGYGHIPGKTVTLSEVPRHSFGILVEKVVLGFPDRDKNGSI